LTHWNPEENPLKLFCPELDELEQQLLQSYDECEAWRLFLEQEQAALAAERAALQSEQDSIRLQQADFQHQSQQAMEHPPVDHAAIDELQGKLQLAEQELELLREQTSEQAKWAEQHKQERNQHEEQYSALELELEHVRNRAGELFDTLACARSEWDLEKCSWEQERQELQALLAHQQEQIKDYLVRHEPHSTEATFPPEAAVPGMDSGTKKEDAVVVGSVLAQFERIRNERAIRRRKSGDAG
jgi:DNA repair exonuclease SbcCD ATPase subunit